eukprot:COSAG04_NODE_1209_length_7722_cov_6.080415_6_plen_232_part_00
MRTPDPGGCRTAATWSRGRWATATPSQHRSPRPPTARSPAPAPGTSGSRSASSLSRTTRDGRARDECARLGSVAVWRWRDGAARRHLHSTAHGQQSAPAAIAGASKKSRCLAFVPTSSTSCAAWKQGPNPAAGGSRPSSCALLPQRCGIRPGQWPSPTYANHLRANLRWKKGTRPFWRTLLRPFRSAGGRQRFGGLRASLLLRCSQPRWRRSKASVDETRWREAQGLGSCL